MWLSSSSKSRSHRSGCRRNRRWPCRPQLPHPYSRHPCEFALCFGYQTYRCLGTGHFSSPSGWLGGAKVSCIFCHRGVQLILAYSWARPAILVAGKGRVMFLFLLYLHFNSCSSSLPVPLFHLFCYLFCLFSPFLWETTQNDPQGLTCR